MTKKFKGLLNEPLKPITTNNLADFLRGGPDPEQLQERKELEEEKLLRVFEHYSIEEDNPLVRYQQLALCLLRDFVPGFQIADPNVSAGRERVWTYDRLSFLVNEMELHMRAKKAGATQAAVVLAVNSDLKLIQFSSNQRNETDTPAPIVSYVLLV